MSIDPSEYYITPEKENDLEDRLNKSKHCAARDTRDAMHSAYKAAGFSLHIIKDAFISPSGGYWISTNDAMRRWLDDCP